MKKLIGGCFDITLRYVVGRGWLPIIKTGEGKEILRGEFKSSAEDALNSAQENLEDSYRVSLLYSQEE